MVIKGSLTSILLTIDTQRSLVRQTQYNVLINFAHRRTRTHQHGNKQINERRQAVHRLINRQFNTNVARHRAVNISGHTI